MYPVIWLGVVLLIGIYVYNYWRCFSRNLDAARKSNIPYIVVPIYSLNRFWLITHRLWLPLIQKLPTSWTQSWLGFMDPEWLWQKKFEAFETMGSDFFLVCSPGRNALFVANAEVVSQIVTRRNDFRKPIKLYASLDLFGKNVVSTEGHVWRHHRKITSPPFTESNNHLVWEESLRQGRSMVTSWIAKEGAKKTDMISDVSAATMRLSLYVISFAGFGVKLLWPHEEIKERGRAGVVPEGHTLTYKDALSTLLENILPVMLLPKWFLSRAPFESIQVSHNSFVEWGKYMREIYEAKKIEIKNGGTREGLDLMGALMGGAGITAESLQENEKLGTPAKQMLTDDEILGNSFVFILAGHETAANTLHFAMLHLAMNWSSQARLQKDLDEIFGDRPVSDWDYDEDVPMLFGTMCGAVMNEILRLIPPVVGIPKCTTKGSPQPMTVGEKRVIIPEDCHITLDAPAIHRNPKYWPTMCGPKASAAEIETDLDAFKPERWLLDHPSSQTPGSATASATELHAVSDADDFGGPAGQDTAATLFRPPRGAYIPFSEGARGCLGRRFAQVEVLAVLAVIFREYSVELALDEYATEQELAEMTETRKREKWDKSKTRAEGLLKWGMMTIITLQMRQGKVPMRFVRRGNESYKFD